MGKILSYTADSADDIAALSMQIEQQKIENDKIENDKINNNNPKKPENQNNAGGTATVGANISVNGPYWDKVSQVAPDYAKKVEDAEKRQKELISMGWSKKACTLEMVEDLNDVMERYGINTKENRQYFIAECAHESNYGRSFAEYTSGNKHDYGEKYKGAGAIQITWESGYQAFATYEIQEKYPDKDYKKYKSPGHADADTIEKIYNQTVEIANENGYDIKKYTNIVDKGAPYVAENYIWESAGYYWKSGNRKGEDMSELIIKGATLNDLNDIINPYDTALNNKRRADAYNQACKYIS